jgi:TrmH family RNA methyltransferase
VEMYNPKVLRSTMGGIFHIPVMGDVDLLSTISRAKGLGFRVYVTDLAGELHVDKVNYNHRSLIVFGNEAWGVSDQVKQLADDRLVIRKYGAAESLNVGVACGIVLSCIHRLRDP